MATKHGSWRLNADAEGIASDDPLRCHRLEAVTKTVGSAKPQKQVARGGMRPIPVYGQFPSDLPISREEIQIVLAVIGPDLAALFSEDG